MEIRSVIKEVRKKREKLVLVEHRSEMSELRIDVSDLRSVGEDLIKELAVFLEEKQMAKIETAENEIIVKGEEEEAISRKCLRMLKDFMRKKSA